MIVKAESKPKYVKLSKARQVLSNLYAIAEKRRRFEDSHYWVNKYFIVKIYLRQVSAIDRISCWIWRRIYLTYLLTAWRDWVASDVNIVQRYKGWYKGSYKCSSYTARLRWNVTGSTAVWRAFKLVTPTNDLMRFSADRLHKTTARGHTLMQYLNWLYAWSRPTNKNTQL